MSIKLGSGRRQVCRDCARTTPGLTSGCLEITPVVVLGSAEDEAGGVHFEVCNVPSYEAIPTLIQPRYSFLGDIYSDIALRVESLREILADKIVALIARSHIKARDVWDLRGLAQKGLTPGRGIVRAKLADYRVENVSARADEAAERLSAPRAEADFVAEMTRFVTPSLARQMQSDRAFAAAWLDHARAMLDQICPGLDQ